MPDSESHKPYPLIERSLSKRLTYLASIFPVIMLTGPRQSGKSTLLKALLPEYRYVNLEEPDTLQLAKADPRGFLSVHQPGLIIDEAQRYPELFSYIQAIVDEHDQPGMFVLSGSENFLLMEKTTQSLAGRVAVLSLLPLSYQELQAADLAPMNQAEWVYLGGYPRIHANGIDPVDFFPSYRRTYIERDVSSLRAVTDHSRFADFMGLCAGRVGQILDVASLANDSGLTVKTVNAWLSVLEASYVLFRLRPYHRNFNKRLIKSPKLYFYDTGLVCSLLGISSADQLGTHYAKGSIFENSVIVEYLKQAYQTKEDVRIYYWRDSHGVEIDFLVEDATRLSAIEVKSSATMSESAFTNLKKFQGYSGLSPEACYVVYSGEQALNTSRGVYLPWRSFKFDELVFGEIDTPHLPAG